MTPASPTMPWTRGMPMNPVLLNSTEKRSTFCRSGGSPRKASRLIPRAAPIHRAGRAMAISSS